MNLQVISYEIFAPISAICQIILVYGYLKVKKMQKHPEIMIFWQCLSQIILDAHWLTGIPELHDDLTGKGCQILGAFFVYFYYLSWNYVLFLSVELIKKIKDPLKCNYKRRLMVYHILSHSSSLTVFICLIAVDNNNGQSLIHTCFVEKNSPYELIIMLPVIIHLPICLYICAWTIWYSLKNNHAALLRPHVNVVLAFSISWVPIGLAHGLSYPGFHTPQLWILNSVINYLDSNCIRRAFRIVCVYCKNDSKRDLYKNP